SDLDPRGAVPHELQALLDHDDPWRRPVQRRTRLVRHESARRSARAHARSRSYDCRRQDEIALPHRLCGRDRASLLADDVDAEASEENSMKTWIAAVALVALASCSSGP